MLRLVYSWLVVIVFVFATFATCFHASDSVDRLAYRVNNRRAAVDIVDCLYLVAHADDDVQYYVPDSKPYAILVQVTPPSTWGFVEQLGNESLILKDEL